MVLLVGIILSNVLSCDRADDRRLAEAHSELRDLVQASRHDMSSLQEHL